MKFSELFSMAEIRGTSFEYKGDEYFRGANIGKCVRCGENTDWISISFECFICSTECADKEWAEYFEAERKAANFFTFELKNTKTDKPKYEQDVLVLYPQNPKFWAIGRLREGNDRFGDYFDVDGTGALYLYDYSIYWTELPNDDWIREKLSHE